MIPLQIEFIKEYFVMSILWRVECIVTDVDPSILTYEYYYCWAYKYGVIKFLPPHIKSLYDFNIFTLDEYAYTIELDIHKLNLFNFDTEEQADMFIKECKLFIDHYNENVLKISPFHIEIQDQFTI